MLKERLCFDPEFWNLLTLRTHCLELMHDKVMRAAVLNEMKEEEKQYSQELLTNNCVNDSCTQYSNSCQCTEVALVNPDLPEEQTINGKAGKCVTNNTLLKRRKWRRRLRSRKQPVSDDEADLGDDPEFKYNLKSTSLDNKAMYSLRCNHTNIENFASVKLPLNRKREYLSRCVKSQFLKRKGQKKRWLQGVPRAEQVQKVKEKKVKVKGKKRGRKPLQKLEVFYPDNEIFLTEYKSGLKEECDTEDQEQDIPHLETEMKDDQLVQINSLEMENDFEKQSDLEQTQEKTKTEVGSKPCECPLSEPQVDLPAVQANPELDGPTLELLDCPTELHSYSLKSKKPESEKLQPPESSEPGEVNGDAELETQPTVKTEVSNTEVSYLSFFILLRLC